MYFIVGSGFLRKIKLYAIVLCERKRYAKDKNSMIKFIDSLASIDNYDDYIIEEEVGEKEFEEIAETENFIG